MKTIIFNLALLSTLGTAALSAASYFPLETGNTWTYRNNATGRGFTVRVSIPALVNGKVYYSLQGYVGSNVMARVNEENTLVYLDNDTNEERPLLSFTPMESGWWNAPYRACEQESQTQVRRTQYQGPAGEFQDVLNIRFRTFSCADAGTELEQFSENIGMLRRVEQTFAGPQQFDLVYARVGNTIVNALPNGSFSVTLDPGVGSGPLTAVLRLRLNGSLLKLTYPTAQEYDVVLRDERGAVLWTWSDGRFFAQAMHDSVYITEWTAAVQIPRPSGATAEPKNYSIHAWFTNEGVPAFAATSTVRF